jgi:hypothetical protein
MTYVADSKRVKYEISLFYTGRQFADRHEADRVDEKAKSFKRIFSHRGTEGSGTVSVGPGSHKISFYVKQGSTVTAKESFTFAMN